MNTDRRIYFTTAIVALVLLLAISFLSRSDPLAAAPAAVSLNSGQGIVVREATDAVQAIGLRAPAHPLEVEPAAPPADVVRLARANPAL